MENENVPSVKVELTESQKNIEQVANMWGSIKTFVYICLGVIENLAVPLYATIVAIIVLCICYHEMNASAYNIIRDILSLSVVSVFIGAVWKQVKSFINNCD